LLAPIPACGRTPPPQVKDVTFLEIQLGDPLHARLECEATTARLYEQEICGTAVCSQLTVA